MLQLLKNIFSTIKIKNNARSPTARITNAPFRFFSVKGANELCGENDDTSLAFFKQTSALGRNIFIQRSIRPPSRIIIVLNLRHFKMLFIFLRFTLQHQFWIQIYNQTLCWSRRSKDYFSATPKLIATPCNSFSVFQNCIVS